MAKLRHFSISVLGTFGEILNVPSFIYVCIRMLPLIHTYIHVGVCACIMGCSMLIGTTAKNLHFTALGAGFQRLLSQLS